MTYQDQIIAAANRYGVPSDIALSVAYVESNFNPTAVGAAGEYCMFQLMPATAQALQVNRYNVSECIDGGVRLLRDEYDRFGSWPLALAAYNAGATNVSKGYIPQEYVAKVEASRSMFGGSATAVQSLPESGPVFSVTKEQYLPPELAFTTASLLPSLPPGASPWLLALLVGAVGLYILYPRS